VARFFDWATRVDGECHGRSIPRKQSPRRRRLKEPRNPRCGAVYHGDYTTTAAFVALRRLRRLVTLATGDVPGFVCGVVAPVLPGVGRVVVAQCARIDDAPNRRWIDR
jgi:hypothetical protein